MGLNNLTTRFSRPQFVFVSPWLLAAATGLLVLIILTFALNNMQREKRLMTASMLQKAEILMRVIHSGARSSYIRDLRRGLLQSSAWQEHVQRVLEHISDDPGILFLAVVDEQGKVIAHSQPSLLGEELRPLDEWQSPGEGPDAPLFQIRESESRKRIFVAQRRFIPFQPSFNPADFPFFPKLPREPDREFLPRSFENKLSSKKDQKPYFLIIGQDMSSYDKSLKQLHLQVAILSLAMLLVGVGGWLSLAAVQGYRGARIVLREMQAFTALLVARMPVGIITAGIDGRVTTWNRAAADLLGVTEDQAAGKIALQLLPPPLAGLLQEGQQGEGEETPGQGRRADIVFESSTGQHSVLAQHLAIRDQKGTLQGQLLLLSDLTDLKKMELQLRENERLAAIGRMAAGVAHEVRNPLSSVKGLALLLQNKFEPGSRERENAVLLIQEAERMNRTIAELLTFARPAKLVRQPVDIASLLRRQLRLLQTDMDATGIQVVDNCTDDRVLAAGDEDQLGQVVLNILLNAIQAMEQGGVLSVRTGSDGQGRIVRIEVTDTGCGMASEQQQQVFYPYFTTKAKGTGIGLALSHKIITDHGGTITLQSEQGRGTTVTVTLPAYQ